MLNYDGTPITARFIVDAISKKLSRRQREAVSQEGACAMTYIAKPKFHHPKLATNKLGFTHRDYEGADFDPVRRLRP